MRKTFKSNVRFMLMNSFSTSDDTLEFLQKYPELANDPNLELVQVRRSAQSSKKSAEVIKKKKMILGVVVPTYTRV